MSKKTITEDEAQMIARAYFQNRFNEPKALMAVGYSENYARRGGKELFKNVQVIQAIEQMRARQRAIDEEVTPKVLKTMYLDDRDFATGCRQAGARVQATKNIATLYGLDKSEAAKEQVVIVIGPKPNVRPVVSQERPEDSPERPIIEGKVE